MFNDLPKFVFFTGKGGVGKTSLACATALNLAGNGLKVLLVSTDPASNVGQVFETEIGNKITTISSVGGGSGEAEGDGGLGKGGGSGEAEGDGGLGKGGGSGEAEGDGGLGKGEGSGEAEGDGGSIKTGGLDAIEINPEEAAAEYRERIVGPMRGILPAEALKSIEEQLSGACTIEIAAFDEFTALLTDNDLIERYDHVVFDTAPTGHTIRMLKLPGAWSGFLESGKGDASCLGPLAGLEKQRERYGAAVDRLSDAASTRLILVARPRQSALLEVARTCKELASIGIKNQQLAINGMMPEDTNGDPLAEALLKRDHDALAGMKQEVANLPRKTFALRSENLVGIDALKRFAMGEPDVVSSQSGDDHFNRSLPTLGSLVDDIELPGKGLVMFMGKGGVGKTTMAAAVATELAARGHEVLLTTTDPAAHITETLAGSLENLTVSRIDPAEETAKYHAHVMATKGKNLDDQARAMLEEDLRSPCTEEIAVFQAFSRVIRESTKHFVIMDTAPTGHTLLLLDATGSYHRDILRHAGTSSSGKLVTPMMRLQNPELTKILLVTLPETTPVLEASHLQNDLRRADIEPWGWIINSSLAAAATSQPLLQQRARSEREQIAKVRDELSTRYAVVPMQATEPVGIEKLQNLCIAPKSSAAA